MTTVRLPQAFGPEAARHWFDQWQVVGHAPILEIEVPSAFELQAGGVALLATCVADRRERRLSTAFICTDGADGLPWFFLQTLGEHRDLGVHAAFIEPPVASALETALTAIVDLRTAKHLADLAGQFLENSPLPSRAASTARFVFEELGANVVHHSKRPETGIGLMQVNRRRSRFELAFADCGVGFLASLARDFEFTGRVDDDAQALRLALHVRITSRPTSQQNMGHGLPALLEFSDSLGGDLWIASGEALLQRRTAAAGRVNSIRPIPHWQGAWICLDPPLP